MIAQKETSNLDKLIVIAKEFRNGSINESMFYDVIFELKLKGKENLISECRDYLTDNGVILVSGNNDVEEDDERIDDSVVIEPYDVSNIDISPKPLTLDIIIGRLANDEIDLLPDFQRKAGLWSDEQKSQLIESLILRIPLPAFYFDGSDADRWIVIDGLQRLTALKEFFVDKTLALTGLEFLKDLIHTKFDNLPRAYQRRMTETQVTAYIINPGAPINLKYNIFKRINTGGLRLEPQEIRHALYQGYATTFIKELADADLFKKITGYSVKTDRMLDREFVLRFIAFYEQPLSSYNGSIELFLNNAMDFINKNYDPIKNPGYASKIKKIFEETLQLNEAIFGKFAFRKMPDMEKRRPISKALFEIWTSSLAKLTDKERGFLKINKKNLIRKYIALYKDRDFVESLSSAKVYSVKKRYEKIDELIRGVLNGK